jgi:hypothetical protein
VVSEESTTPDLVDLRRFVDAFARGDFDAAAAMYSEGGVLDASRLGIGIFEGRAAISEVMADWFAPYEALSAEPEELCALGSGVSFTVLAYRGQPGGSDRFVEVRHAYLTTWVDGLAVRNVVYDNIDEARAAAGRLAEERG